MGLWIWSSYIILSRLTSSNEEIEPLKETGYLIVLRGQTLFCAGRYRLEMISARAKKDLATYVCTAHCYNATRKALHTTKTAISNDEHYERAPYTNKSGCVFGTPAPIHLAPCRALEQ